VLKLNNIYISSKLSSIKTNRHSKHNVVFRDHKNLYVLCLGISTLCIPSNQSLIKQCLFPDVLKLDCIYSSQLSSIGTNRHAIQNVIRDLKTGYMLWSLWKVPIYSFQSKSDWIIFIPRCVKARIQFTIKFNRNGSPRETTCYSRSRNAIFAVARNKVPYVFIPIKSDWIIFITRHVKARLYIYIYFTINFERIGKRNKTLLFAIAKRVLRCGQEWNTLCIQYNQNLIG
jgi:hypothetical protein